MSFRNGDKARSGRLRKLRNARRKKTAELRTSLAQAAAEKKPDTVAKKTARKIGSTLGTIATATHLSGKE
jgi:hypothetical protein